MDQWKTISPLIPFFEIDQAENRRRHSDSPVQFPESKGRVPVDAPGYCQEIQQRKGGDSRSGKKPKEQIMKEVTILMEVINVKGVEVVCSLEKIVDVVTVYYAVRIGDESQEVFGPEEFAMEVYKDYKARATKGPIDGKYLFISDEDRDFALAIYKETPWYEEGK